MENKTIIPDKKNKFHGLKHVFENYLGEWKPDVDFISTPRKISLRSESKFSKLTQNLQ